MSSHKTYDISQYEIDDPSFVNDLKKSDNHVDKVVDWLQKQGVQAKKKTIRIRGQVKEMSKFSDDGDIEIIWKNKKEIVEVKQRRLNFTSAKDFPYQSIIVDAAHIWEKANPKPITHILTNEKITHCVIVWRKTSSQWKHVEKWDRFKKRKRRFFECPIALLEFRQMT